MSPIEPIVHLVTDDEVKDSAKQLFEQVKSSTGSVPKWMRVMANNEDILVGFFTMFKAIMDDSPVEKILKWRIALRISDINKCDYCVSVAKQQLSNFGLTTEEIQNIETQPLSDRDKAAMDYALASTQHAYNIDDNIMQNVKKYFTDAQIVEISSVVGLFNFINRFNDSLGVFPDIT